MEVINLLAITPKRLKYSLVVEVRHYLWKINVYGWAIPCKKSKRGGQGELSCLVFDFKLFSDSRERSAGMMRNRNCCARGRQKRAWLGFSGVMGTLKNNFAR